MAKNMIGREEKKSQWVREKVSLVGDVAMWYDMPVENKASKTASVFGLSILHALQHYFFFVFAFIFVSGSSTTGSNRDGRNGMLRPTNTKHKE